MAMQIPEIIENLRCEYCGRCKVGTCMRALEKLAEDSDSAPEFAAIGNNMPIAPPDTTVKKTLSVECPKCKELFMGKDSCIPMSDFAKKASNREPTAADKYEALRYITNHPGCGISELANHLGIGRRLAYQNVQSLGSQVRILSEPNTHRAVWFSGWTSGLCANENPLNITECPECNELFVGMDGLERHAKLVHGKSVECPKCKEVLVNKSGVWQVRD
jgi:hypothetical protein